MESAIEEDFAVLLMQDALAAIRRHEKAPTQLTKRDLVRTLFAASEGFVWTFREHVVEAAEQTGNLDPAEAMALKEETYSVTESGKIVTQRRYITLTSSIRLCARIAQRLDADLQVTFNETGWSNFRTFIVIRNRLTHPKKSSDLDISDAEIDTCVSSFFWLLDVLVRSIEAAHRARKKFLAEFTAVLNGLKLGDPALQALYERALKED